MAKSVSSNSFFVVDISKFEATLQILDKEKLGVLLKNLAAKHPDWIPEIQAEALKLFHDSGGATSPDGAAVIPPAMDLKMVQKQVRVAIKSSRSEGRGYSYYNDGGEWEDLEAAVGELIDEAMVIARAGSPKSTLAVFEAIAAEILDHDDDFEYTETSTEELFDDLAAAWTEAILLSELTDEERSDWEDRALALTEAENISGMESLEMAATTAEQGWDYPALVRVLQGEITEFGAWEPDEEVPDYADTLAKIRLDILERQGRLQEAIYLAEAEGETGRFLTLLVMAGRAEEAVKAGLEQIATPAEALSLARRLAESQEAEGAFTVAEYGIRLPAPEPRGDFLSSYAPPKRELGLWLRDYAILHGRNALALEAGKIAYEEVQTLDGYLLLQKLSGDSWETLREELLECCRTPRAAHSSGAIDILLYEKEFLVALKHVESTGNSSTERVAEAAMAAHPDEVIVLCKKRAEAIMNAGDAKHYDVSQRWLRLVKDAYLGANREQDWQNYRASILDIHGRKYKLVPLIRAV